MPESTRSIISRVAVTLADTTDPIIDWAVGIPERLRKGLPRGKGYRQAEAQLHAVLQEIVERLTGASVVTTAVSIVSSHG